MSSTLRRTKRWLFLAHRWVGIAGCLMLAVWFASGLVMMYVAFPELTREERLAGLPPIAWDKVAVTPDAALAKAQLSRYPARFILEMSADRPVYRIVGQDGERISLSAVDGARIDAIDAREAVRIAEAFSGKKGGLEETLDRDQWTVPQGLDPLRPLHLIALDDAQGSKLYVSARNGEVVRDTTRRERFWNWLGSVPHWLYFTSLRADQPLWRQVNLWVSGILIFVPVSGLFIGVLRLRLRHRYASGKRSPYRGWHRWHHVAGLVGGVFLLAWVVSGWLSVNPNRWFAERGIGAQRLLDYGGHVDASFAAGLPPVASLNPPDGAPAKEARFSWITGRAQIVLTDSKGRRRLVEAATGAPARLDPDRLFDAAHRLVPDGSLVRRVVLTQEDAYWYSHHGSRPLPILRAVFDDPYDTWVHIDPQTGAVLGQLDDSDRAQRWLFNAMHQMDYPWLVRHRPLWDAVVIPLLLCGLLISLSGVVIGVRRLRRYSRHMATTYIDATRKPLEAR